MNVKKALSEETEVVKQLDTERRAFKETPIGNGRRRPASPPISTKSSFVFQPLDEYPTSSSSGPGPMDDPDVWRPPSRDATTAGSRRPAAATRGPARKSPQDGAWARGGPTRPAAGGRGAKAGGAGGRVNSGARGSTAAKKGTASGKSSKADSVVSVAQFSLLLVIETSN